jgi:hypothetical protein
VGECPQVLLLERVVERALPGNQADLSDRVGADDEHDPGGEQIDLTAPGGALERASERRELGDEPARDAGGRWLRRRRLSGIPLHRWLPPGGFDRSGGRALARHGRTSPYHLK